jgi:peptidyl-prolyl cis-trans isomerase A (cyclophilin A)
MKKWKFLTTMLMIFALLTVFACKANVEKVVEEMQATTTDEIAVEVFDEPNHLDVEILEESEPQQLNAAKQRTPEVKDSSKIMVVMKTSLGDIEIELDRDLAPITVDNFVGLAMGTREYTDPRTGQRKTDHYYDGLIFHRVIDNFMIQGGCPLGTGTGGPGYNFECETLIPGTREPRTTVDYGTLCMANAGPNTNGSQFFIVTKRDGADWLNGRHTVFGRVVSGMDVVHSIENVQKGPNDRPVNEVKIISIRTK